MQIHEPADQRQQLHVCLLPDFHLNLKTTTLLGSRAKLQGMSTSQMLTFADDGSIADSAQTYPN